MNTNRDLNYRLYLQEMNGFKRTAFTKEFEKYMLIQSGDVETVRSTFEEIRKDFLTGKGQLSSDPLRNLIYHLVVSVAVTSRVCIEGGMNHDAAYTLSDIYIRRADTCGSCEEVIDLIGEMQADFAARMRELKMKSAISLHVRKCIDYIYENLHGELTVKVLAKLVKLNPTYLSRLFMKEVKTSIKEFITEAKIATAENMLQYSDFSYLDISLALGYSSQSAFIIAFKKVVGTTPKKYRDRCYLKSITSGSLPAHIGC